LELLNWLNNWFGLSKHNWSYINFDRLAYQSFFNTHFHKYYYKLIKSSTYLTIDMMSILQYPHISSHIKNILTPIFTSSLYKSLYLTQIQSKKAIIVIRDPIETAYINYINASKNLKDSFEETILNELDNIDELDNVNNSDSNDNNKFLFSGKYDELIPQYIDIFGKDNVLVFCVDEFSLNYIHYLNIICRFLNIEEFKNDEVGNNMKNNLNNARKLYLNQYKNISSSCHCLNIATLNKLNIYYHSTYEYIKNEFGIILNKRKDGILFN
jgi:hypothetical protein